MLIIIKLVIPFVLYKISWIYHFVLLKGNTSVHTDFFFPPQLVVKHVTVSSYSYQMI